MESSASEARPWRIAAVTLLFLLIAAMPVSQTVGTPATAQAGGVQVGCIITGTTIAPGVCVLDSVPLMMIGILLSFMVIAITYMLGNVINYERMKNWYRTELWETIKSLMVVAIIISALVLLSAVANALGGNQATVPSGPADLSALNANLAGLYMTANSMYLYPQLENSYVAFDALQGLAIGNSAIQSLKFNYFLPIPIPFPWPPFPIIGMFKSGAETNVFQSNYISFTGGGFSITSDAGSSIVVPVLLAFQIQYDMFFYIVALGLGILIPVGIILRAFPLLRNLGGTAIALGIGVSLIYPSLLVIFNLPISNYMYTFTAANVQTGGSSCPFTSTLLCQLWGGVTTIISPISDLSGVNILGNLAFGQFGNSPAATQASYAGIVMGLISPLATGTIYPTLNFVIDNVIGLVLQFILMALDILIGLILANNVASLLGGTLRLGVWNIKLV